MKADMKARVSNLIKTEAEWQKLNFKPLPGELIIYAPEKTDEFSCVRIKVGDGIHTIHDLPFVIDYTLDERLSIDNQVKAIDPGRITKYFKTE